MADVERYGTEVPVNLSADSALMALGDTCVGMSSDDACAQTLGCGTCRGMTSLPSACDARRGHLTPRRIQR